MRPQRGGGPGEVLSAWLRQLHADALDWGVRGGDRDRDGQAAVFSGLSGRGAAVDGCDRSHDGQAGSGAFMGGALVEPLERLEDAVNIRRADGRAGVGDGQLAAAPAADSSVLVGFPAAEQYLGFDGNPSTIYVRADDGRVDAVDNLLGPTANPQDPSQVDVSQPSAALVAQADAQGAFDGLFLGLGAVALLAGAVGVANIMIISVLERRSEIGLRRALGATRGHIRVQFLAEAVLLALIGGVAGVGAGALATAVYATSKHELVVIPALAWSGGIGAAIFIGAIAGLWPALRAARISPTRALWSL